MSESWGVVVWFMKISFPELHPSSILYFLEGRPGSPISPSALGLRTTVRGSLFRNRETV